MSTNTFHDIRFGGGMTDADTTMVRELSAPLLARVAQHGISAFDAELSVKERDGKDQKTTLELWGRELPRIVATSDQSDLGQAVQEVCNTAMRQMREALEKREPMNNRGRRETIRS